ncbi:unnamed protein product [Toxocara canis]|uniref:Secreted protein n=1 Tax=Toxocara canis TaxID=6265 RepID=A0A183UHN2_TOXCA|nr:unnamed protein product [Toxocara canis]
MSQLSPRSSALYDVGRPTTQSMRLLVIVVYFFASSALSEPAGIPLPHRIAVAARLRYCIAVSSSFLGQRSLFYDGVTNIAQQLWQK